MKSTLLIGTRKGLVVCKRKSAGWRIDQIHFDGIPVSFAYEDERNGDWWACLDHGHWGVKLHRSKAHDLFHSMGFVRKTNTGFLA